MSWHDAWGGGAMVFMALATIVVWMVVVVVIVGLVRSRRSNQPDIGGCRTDGVESILSARFARGEIDADEYKQRRDLLRSN